MAARHPSDWNALNRLIVDCRRCPRLVEYCRQVARAKRAAFRDCDYWGRPVSNFGDARGRLLIVGLAPAAHGANRTGRMFTGDRSGQWLFRALHKARFANRPDAAARGDGLQLSGCAITAAIHCAPPANKPLPGELAHCREWFQRTIDIMPVVVFLALGHVAWRALVAEARRRAWHSGPMPKFAHEAQVELAGGRWLLGSYHPSQQNTQTGRLTEPMFDRVFRAARKLLKSA
ncbi:MAG: uracil-DNA glycosylase [Pirellulales bacterium]